MSLSVALRHAFSGFALDLAFEAPPGVTALFGRSGSGKTTVVNALAGLISVDAGHARVGGETLFDTSERVFVPPHLRRIGYVFQEARLFPHLTVRQNLGYGRWFARRHGAEVADMGTVVEMLGIGALLARRPGTLSGGERQRVAIGRALLSGPRLLLMDEPLASLDEARKTEILPYLERLSRETRVPILYVSHSVAEVARLATTVVALSEGRVVRSGTPAEVLSDPQAVPTLGIRDAGAVIAATVAAHHPDGLSELATSGGRLLLPHIAAAPGTLVRVRIHAHDVMLSLAPQEGISALNQLPVEIVSLRRGEGPGVVVQLRCGSDRLLARVTRRSAEALGLAPGLACHAILKSVAVAQEDVWIEGREGR
ncbi:molybdenum ABC transporter ATP-binding protein [Stappia sp. TSB10GB4]|uniref:molybdenum ABC transporter ATP-binding protein n=1 Tax=Stappia sp. TSB10GB4 TaxID=2003584 RepID=UPI0016466211|nr:molybdenum ABC transporter ATP-binding protein [Stappia sp. TSB10GB4]